jgi:hypothetical protein
VGLRRNVPLNSPPSNSHSIHFTSDILAALIQYPSIIEY